VPCHEVKLKLLELLELHWALALPIASVYKALNQFIIWTQLCTDAFLSLTFAKQIELQNASLFSNLQSALKRLQGDNKHQQKGGLCECLLRFLLMQ
jgi:hypothetical protein